jgi:protein TonB
MTGARAVTLPLSFVAHGAALAILAVLSLVPAELPAARAASALPVDAAVFRVATPAASVPKPKPSRPNNRAGVRSSGTPTPTLASGTTEVRTPVPLPPTPADGPSDEDTTAGCLGCEPSPIGTGGSAGVGSEGSEPAGDGAPRRVGGDIREPRKLRHVVPAYPEVARLARVRGTVTLECIVTPEGRVAEVRVVSGNPLLDPAAVRAVEQWQFTPTLLNGVPVPVILTVTVKFDLR